MQVFRGRMRHIAVSSRARRDRSLELIMKSMGRGNMERETGLEPATSSLRRWHSIHAVYLPITTSSSKRERGIV